ncbi:Alpha-(1,3)-fucosyltransferase C [Mizuhopecten yessoensis]|uniref:Fucosyltransferase n=1 Tax=Mizuhopecten yessoensis TaxID=6573 RepID=A0A210Q553_MIZYE|nr:Alpha-(1,3)-fucosyltransferase C [Mizuhopecten yessoensis]
MFKIYWRNSQAIPIGRGRTQYELFFPPNSYLDTSKYQSTKELAEHMWRLSKNETEATTYFKWTSSYFVDRDSNARVGFCELCRRIHDPVLMKKHTRLYRDIDTWLRGSERTQICKTPTDLV